MSKPLITKVCSRCPTVFSKSYITSYCDPCRRAYDNEYNRSHPETHKARTIKAKAYRYNRDFGITVEQRDQLLLTQDSCCAICYTPEPGTKQGWSTDHDHATGVIRGILCLHCNIALGMVKDNTATLQNMIHYLQRSST